MHVGACLHMFNHNSIHIYIVNLLYSTASGTNQNQDINSCDLICHVEFTGHIDYNEDAIANYKNYTKRVDSTVPVDHTECGDQLDMQKVVQIDLPAEKNKPKDYTTAVDNVLINPASFIPLMQVQSPVGCKYKSHYRYIIVILHYLYISCSKYCQFSCWLQDRHSMHSR